MEFQHLFLRWDLFRALDKLAPILGLDRVRELKTTPTLTLDTLLRVTGARFPAGMEQNHLQVAL